MKGVLFNVVEDVVTGALSADAWDDVIDASGVGGAYTSLGNYPDAELVDIVDEVASATSQSASDTLRLSGRLGFEHLASRAPELLSDYADWRAVLMSLDDIIHPEVRKIYPGAEVPSFTITDDGSALLVDYVSARRLCALADGLIVGCGAWYDRELTVTHESCVHDGDARCTMRVIERP